MSSYPETSAQPGSAIPARPSTLTAAIAVAVLSAIAAIANGVLILAGGLDLIKEIGNDLIAAESGMSVAEVEALTGGLLDELYAEAQSTFQTRAYLVLILGAALLLFGLLMRTAAVWARVVVTIAAALTVVFAGVIATDEGTATMLALGWVAVLGSLVTIVLAWLPANGRYAKALA